MSLPRNPDLLFLSQYCFDLARISEPSLNLFERFSNTESVRLAVLSSGTLLYSCLDPSVPPAALQRRAKCLIDAANIALQVEMRQPEISLGAKLAGTLEISGYYVSYTRKVHHYAK